MIETAVAEASQNGQRWLSDYTVVPRFPTEAHPKPAHRWIVEFERRPDDPAAFMSLIDENLRSRNEDYGGAPFGRLRDVAAVLAEVARGRSTAG